MRLLAILALAGTLAAQTAPIDLARDYDCRRWTVTHVALAQAQVARAEKTLTLVNVSATRESHTRIVTDAFPLAPLTKQEPGLPRLRATWTAKTTLPRADRNVWISIHTPNVFGSQALYSTDDDFGCIAMRVTQQPQPITSSFLVFDISLAPSQSYTITSTVVNEENGPTVTARMNPHLVAVDIQRSGHGGNPLAFVFSPTTFAAPVPVPGFAGVGLLVMPDIVLRWPISQIVLPDPKLISLLRTGSWQAVETSPVPALGWPVKG